MGAIEAIFFVLLAVFTVVGIVRGFGRELGVTVFLLLGLFVLDMLNRMFPEQLDTAVGLFVGPDTAVQHRAEGLIAVVVLCVLVFISYQGQTFSFSGSTSNWLLGLAVGLLNGYLFAGSLWFYLAQAGWPILGAPLNPTALYQTVEKFLPPAVFSWHWYIAFVVLLLISRVIK